MTETQGRAPAQIEQQALGRIIDARSKNQLPTIILDYAKFHCSLVPEHKHTLTPSSTAAACVFIAYWARGIPCSTNDIASMFGIKSKCILPCITILIKYISIPEPRYLLTGDSETDHLVEDYIRRLGPELGMSMTDIDLAIKISRNSSKLKLGSDHAPRSIAAGSI